ncbi:MAG: tetratricopeptide repeat protein [Acidobacteriota bacterium]|nr:tetratricopeptide repeat protein [Acidobacteriota bacterium]
MRTTIVAFVLLAAHFSVLTTAEAQDVTFTRDIAPIVFKSCVSCHRKGGPAPFALTTYDEVRRRATQIATVTNSRFMPPWKVEPGVGHFVGQDPLTGDQIAQIEKWAAAGAPQGEPGALPPLPRLPDGWLLGQPDLIVKPSRAYTLAPQPNDAFRIFAIRLPVTKRTYVRGIEFHPGNPRVVHHANIRIDRTDATRKLDEADPLPGYDGLMPRSAEYPDGHFLGWTPGQVAPLVPPDLAWTLEPGSDLVVQLHLQPSGAVEQVLPEVGLYFSDQPPTRTPTILRLGSQAIEIPPGEPRYVISDSYTLPVDADLLAVQPHAHYRAREIRGTAHLPDGTSRVVMHITDWDFRWQHVYRHATPIRLPKGTRLSMEYTYDNSADNIRNPELPPAKVYWGQRSKDEMGDLWFQLLAANDRDRQLMRDQIATKMTVEDIAGYETMLRVDPNDAELHDDVALLYMGIGQMAPAIRHFEATVSLKPDLAAARFNLGTALAQAGRLDDAVAAFRAALARRADYALAHNNLGQVLLAQGKIGDALRHLQEAVRRDPANPQALFGLSEAYAMSGSFDLAIETIDRAIKLPMPEALATRVLARRAEYLRRLPE